MQEFLWNWNCSKVNPKIKQKVFALVVKSGTMIATKSMVHGWKALAMVNTKRLESDISHFKFQNGMDGKIQKNSSLFLAEDWKRKLKRLCSNQKEIYWVCQNTVYKVNLSVT